MELSLKQKQFNDAMERYDSLKRYQLVGTFVSVANISLQIYLLVTVWPVSIGALRQVAALAAAYVVADFVNGFVHLFMDDNDDYQSVFGPLIANFHLHHRNIRYAPRSLLVVYFKETGSKIWLVPYLLSVALLWGSGTVTPPLMYALVYFGILSSVAEVSHYLCHNSNSRVGMFLARTGLLLPKRHHAAHHLKDNNNYAFLNGLTDPLLNRIARRFYQGYKQKTDLHYACYRPEADRPGLSHTDHTSKKQIKPHQALGKT